MKQLFANNVDRKLLPKNILILNARQKWETLLEFCLEYDINFKIFEIADDEQFKQPNISEKLKPYTTFLPLEKYWDTEYYIKTLDFEPEWILNCRDEVNITTVEYELARWYNTKTQFDDRALKFGTSKKEQDRVCKLMGIPTIDEGDINDKIIIKKDYGFGGGSGYEVASKKAYISNWYDDVDPDKAYILKENDFIQRYLNYDYTIICHTLIDGNGDYHIYNNSIGKYGDGFIVGNNIPYLFMYPFTHFPKEEIDIIEEFCRKLKENITVRNRIIFLEFCKERNGKLYFQEVNFRPSGEFEIGTFDWRIGKYNTLVDLFTGTVQEEIEYYQQKVSIFFESVLNNELFGWGSNDGDGRKDTTLPYPQKIKIFNTKTK